MTAGEFNTPMAAARKQNAEFDAIDEETGFEGIKNCSDQAFLNTLEAALDQWNQTATVA